MGSRQTLKDKVYSNCKMFKQDGTFMCYCSEKKMKWYLKRGSTQLDEQSFQLNFEPNGDGHSGDDYYLERRVDQCVVCGTKENLTKHHVVPYQYRKHFSEERKSHSHFDVLCVCGECHDKYESKATTLNKKLAEQYGIDMCSPMDTHEKGFLKVLGFVNALQRHGESIPEERIQVMLDFISDWNGSPITLFDIDSLVDVFDGMTKVKKGAYAPGKKVLDAWLNDHSDNVLQFIVMWRQHFLDISKPKFISKHWLSEYKTRDTK